MRFFKLKYAVFLFVWCPMILFGQGMKLNDKGGADILLDTLYGTKSISIPPDYNLRKYCPFPMSQEGPICVGAAVGYGARTIYRAISEGITHRGCITDNLAHSAQYVFHRINGNEEGAFLSDAIKLMWNEGVCLNNSFLERCDLTLPMPPYLVTEEDMQVLKAEANKYKIGELQNRRAFDETDKPEKKIEETKKQIAQNNPVIVGFKSTPESGVGKFFKGTCEWIPDSTDTNEGHAMVVIGYDDYTRKFEILNSFGEGWGDSGFIWMDYQHYADSVITGYVLKSEGGKSASKPKDNFIPVFSANMTVKKADYSSGGWMPEWANMTILYDSTDQFYYTKDSLDYELEFLVQVDVPKGLCFYLFKYEELSHSVNLKEIGNLIYPPKDSILILPSENGLINSLGHLKEDNVIGFFSFYPIEDMEMLLSSIKTDGVDFWRKDNEVFQKTFISSELIKYNNENLRFETVKGRDEGYIVPIIFRLR